MTTEIQTLQHTASQLAEAVSEQQIQLSEKIGALKATSFIKKLLTVSEIKLLAEIKETKQYKGLQVFGIHGELLTVSTWAEFCDSLGKSHQHVDEEIRNLSAFGEDFLETSQRMGLGYRDLRKLRQLPAEEQQLIINGEAVKTEDKESLIDMIEEMAVKHAKEKNDRDKQIKQLKEDNQAKDNIIKKKDEKLNEIDAELTKLQNPEFIAQRAENQKQLFCKQAIEHMNTACLKLHNNITRFINDYQAIAEAIEENAAYELQEQFESNLVALFQQIAHISNELAIQIDFENMVTPSWLKQLDTPTDEA